MASKIKAILFDLDGTLRDTKEVVFESFRSTVEKHTGNRPTAEDIAPHVHHSTIVHKVFVHDITYESFLETYHGYLGDAWREAELFPGAIESLDALHDMGYQLAIVTSADHSRALEFLRHKGMDSYFIVVSGMREGMQPKPAPDLVHDALTRLHCTAAQAIMVGDTVADIGAAHAAGVKAVAITHGFEAYEVLQTAQPDYTVDSLAELSELFASFSQ